MSEFDDLFNEYFGGKKNNEGINKMMDLMSKLNSGGGFDGVSPDEKNLGEPTSIREFERDGIMFVESIWETEFGSIIRVSTKGDVDLSSDLFNKRKGPTNKLSLEDRLKLAVKEENYEEAAKLRDKIAKKENKVEASENLDNKGLTEDDDWNF